jgi:hypothetical protein
MGSISSQKNSALDSSQVLYLQLAKELLVCATEIEENTSLLARNQREERRGKGDSSIPRLKANREDKRFCDFPLYRSRELCHLTIEQHLLLFLVTSLP